MIENVKLHGFRSGLPQRDDHNLVVEALCLELKKDHDALRLAPPQ
jgi:uncharacterized protein (UPF0303 family)